MGDLDWVEPFLLDRAQDSILNQGLGYVRRTYAVHREAVWI